MEANYYKGVEFPKGHYFSEKCVLFTGDLDRCSRRDASDRLYFDYGGIPVDRIAVWVDFVVAGRGAEHISNYREAKQLEKDGCLIILIEQEFFDTLDGKYTPPENLNKKESKVTVFYPNGVDPEKYEAGRRAEFIGIKRDDYLRKRKTANNKYDMFLQNDMELRFDIKQVDMMREALDCWGEPAQVYQTIEECAELIVALNKHTTRVPTPETLESVMDEIADVEMMLAQMRVTFGISDEMLKKRIKQKFDKLEKYLKKERKK